MSPLTRSNHTAARIGRWSANHWKTAFIGWLVFVIASVRRKHGRDEVPEDQRRQRRRGPEGRQDHLRGLQEKEDEQGEIVLIRSKTHTAKDPAFRAAINDVTTTLAQFPR